MFGRKLMSVLAAVSLFAAVPALAGNTGGFKSEGPGPSAKHDCTPSAMKRHDAMHEHGSGGGTGNTTQTQDFSDAFNRSMDAGG